MMPRNRYYQGPASDHFDGTRFFNPGEPSTDRGLGDILRWRRESHRAPWPHHVPIAPTMPDARVAGLRVTAVGHATLLIQAAGMAFLTDPVWSERASPFSFAGPRRVTAPGITFDDLPPIDAILLSHNHYDHCDVATLKRLDARDRPLIVAPLGNDTLLRRHLPDARLATGDWGARIAIGESAATTLTPANHWSARGIGDRRMALWSGHMLDTPAGRIWFAGDTGYGTGAIFPALAARHGAPDVALIPIGAYAPRWFMAAQHCDPDEALAIFHAVGARRALGIHWGTFQLTDEPRDEPALRLAAATVRAGLAPDAFAAAIPGTAYDI